MKDQSVWWHARVLTSAPFANIAIIIIMYKCIIYIIIVSSGFFRQWIIKICSNSMVIWFLFVGQLFYYHNDWAYRKNTQTATTRLENAQCIVIIDVELFNANIAIAFRIIISDAWCKWVIRHLPSIRAHDKSVNEFRWRNNSYTWIY